MNFETKNMLLYRKKNIDGILLLNAIRKNAPDAKFFVHITVESEIPSTFSIHMGPPINLYRCL